MEWVTLNLARCRQVLKGVKIEAGKNGKAPHAWLPITPAILQRLKGVWLQSKPSFNALMLWAAQSVTFSSFCCSGEVTVQRMMLERTCP